MMTALLACLLVAADPPPTATTPAGPAHEVLLVPDGQSVVLRVDGRTVTVALLGIAEPETDRQDGARLLRARALRGLLEGQRARLRYEEAPPARPGGVP